MAIYRIAIMTAHLMCIAVVWTISSPAIACTCADIRSLEQELEGSDVIFAGKAIAVDSSIPGRATFEVSLVWRDSVQSIVYTSNMWGCDSVFRSGEEYLVFARRAAGENGLGYDLIPIRCGQSSLLKNSQKALAVLGPGSPPASPAHRGDVRLFVVTGIVLLCLLVIVAGIAIARNRVYPKVRNLG